MPPSLIPLLMALVLLGVNWYFLWETRSEQISGDVLIHLIFARNFAEGRWFEFSHGQLSRANTTFLYEWILAVLGWMTGQLRSHEGFLTVARVLACVLAALAAWVTHLWNLRMGMTKVLSATVCVFVFLNPVTFYWTAVNPMETSLALVFIALTGYWVSALKEPPSWKEGVLGGLFIFGVSQARPEMLAMGPITALALLLGSGWKTWRAASAVVILPLLLTALLAMALALGGIPIMPSSSVARRLMMLTYDASPLPVLGIPANLDAIQFLVLLAPLLLACAWGAFFGPRQVRPACYLVLGICAFSGLFFSFFQFTTWQGRYMLPGLAMAAPVGVAMAKMLKC